MKRFSLLLVSLFLIVSLNTIILVPQAAPAAVDEATPSAASQDTQPGELRFERLTVDDGLPHSTVLSALQDSEGFMWFATADGLARYDGYEFTIFRHDNQDPNSLSHNNLFALIESQDGLLWIGTDNGGLNSYDRKTGHFTAYRNDPEDPNSLVNDSVWSLLEDSQGILWIGTRGGLSRFDRTTNTFTNYLANPDDPHALANSVIYRIYEDKSGTVWLGTRAGLHRYNPDEDNFTIFLNDPENPQSIINSNIWSMLEDSRGNFWVGTRKGGLGKFDRQTGEFQLFSSGADSPVNLNEDTVWSIYEDSSNRLWLATELNGLVYFNRDTGSFTAYRHNPNNPYSLSHSDIYWICEDRSGVMWITSRYNGVNKLVPALQRFKLYRHVPEDPNTLQSNNIFSILAEENGLVWIGTSGGGLSRLDRSTGEMITYTHDPDNPDSISSNAMYDIMKTRDGMLWIATVGGGLNRMDPEQGTFTAYLHDEEDKTTLGSNFLTKIIPAEDDRIWIGTLGFGLELFDPTSAEVVARYQHDQQDSNSLSEDTVYDLVMDSSGNIWIATGRGGVELFDPQTETFTHYRHLPENENSLANDTVQALYLDEPAGILWAGTIEGLSRLEIANGLWRTYTTADGLANSNINSIQPGVNGELWLSTSKGISRLDPTSNTFRNFDVRDGLQGNQFNLFSSFRAPDGELFFGGPNGLTAFYPEDIASNSYLPPVILTDFRLFNRSVSPGDILSNPIDQVDSITLNYDQSVITFEFAAPNYQIPDHNLYQHKLENFETDWSPPENKRTITYTNLDPGEYIFMVRASNNDGSWSEQATQLSIIILPPWWQTWWARLLAVVTLGLIVFGIVQIRVIDASRRNRLLEKHVAERTAELTETNQNLASEIERRQSIEKQLMTMNSRLQEQLEEIKILRDNLREQAIRDELTGLFNRRYLWETMEREMAHSLRTQTTLGILMMDIDHFKQLNDRHTHAAGDLVMKKFGELLLSGTRRGDIACRYGGEEFVVILQDACQEDTIQRAEEIRKSIEEMKVTWNEQELSITVSIGVAIFPAHDSDMEQLLQKADKALYQAKDKGRNCVVVYQE